ncbi:porin family protein [Mucilaginibacter psychrotolerans]|uniref:PorT family protein n=1 Tax=Mucilaginibacter psychrotolerans TaxID=1524096 RepID=A0A4Y8SBE0_9SPHI|nr:porin family protein [Mucilaginibacter psychrotolerans]TFF35955.1 PorT family protein [Mucilaginibacter psychrotolerans]
MKKLILSLAFLGVSIGAFAQIPSVGIKGGINIAKISGSDGSGGTSTSGTLTTFSVGAFLDFKAGALSVQPGLYYTGKGSKSDNQISSASGSLNLRYLQVPVDFVFHLPAVVGNVYIGAGPYVAFGISARSKTSVSASNTSTLDLSFGNDASQIKRMDYGVQGIAGFHFNSGFLIGLNYDLGLSNITNDSSIKSKNRVLGAAIGFTF